MHLSIFLLMQTVLDLLHPWLIDWWCFIHFKLFFKFFTFFLLKISSILPNHNFLTFLLSLHPLILLFYILCVIWSIYFFCVIKATQLISFVLLALFYIQLFYTHSFFFYCGFITESVHDLANMCMKAAPVSNNWNNAGSIPLYKRKSSECEHKK